MSTSYPGVRYREHETRKHGIRPDKYFFIRYKADGKDKEEGVGWASAGMTAEKASKILGEIRENIRKGAGPKSLAEMRALNAEQERELAEKEAREKRQNVDFATFFQTQYLPAVEFTKKPYSLTRERQLFATWLEHVIGKLPINSLGIYHIEAITRNMIKSGKSKRTIQYALAVISQVWNYARKLEIVNGDSPTKKYKIGKLDNERTRFLTEDEAQKLLIELGKHSIDLQQMSALSLFCGLRAGEIFKLRWEDVDFNNNTILLRATKSGKSRYAFMTPEIKTIFESRKIGIINHNTLIFPATNGQQRQSISKVFSLVVDALGLNDGVNDNKNKVVFHTLRHTFASWLAKKGVPLYSIQKLMGHASFQMVQRYAHLSTESMKSAVEVLNDSIIPKQTG